VSFFVCLATGWTEKENEMDAVKNLFFAVLFLGSILGTALAQFAPHQWAEVLHALGL